jgi:hypothetical protein
MNEHNKLKCLFFSVVSKAGAYPRVELNHRYLMLLVRFVEVPGTVLHSLQLMNEHNKLECLFFSVVSKAGAYLRMDLNHRYLMLLV